MIEKICVYYTLEDYFALLEVSGRKFVKVTDARGAVYDAIQVIPDGWKFLYAPGLKSAPKGIN